VVLACAGRAGAQSPPPPAAPARPVVFLSRADFSFLWAKLVTTDPRFTMEGRVDLDLDLLDYGAGRVNFAAEYDAVIGGERRRFDLNQGNYVLEASLSRRTRVAELSVVFHHVSRHLTDRPNPPAISWNVVGVRAERRFAARGSIVDVRFDAGRAQQQAFVDYTWTSDLRVSIRRPVTPRVAVFATGTGGLIGVDRDKLWRPRLCGSRLEGGVRVSGQAAALEVFAGYERRIDAFPTDRFRVRAFTVGFRLVSR
jgi:hypothetical protein